MSRALTLLVTHATQEEMNLWGGLRVWDGGKRINAYVCGLGLKS